MTVNDILIGLAFAAVIEGLVLALAPSRFGELVRKLDEIPLETRRIMGLGIVAAGVIALWLLRS